MNEPRIQLLDELGADFERIARRNETRRRRSWRPARWRTGVAVALLSLVLVTGAGAALDVLPIGTNVPAENVPGKGEPQYTSSRTVVATGTSSAAGRWQVTVADSDRGKCLGLELLDTRSSVLTDVCGGLGSFDVATVGGGDELPNTTFVFGPAPEEATSVRVTAAGSFSETASTYDGPDGIAGNSYVVEIPRKGIHNAVVQWLDDDGRPQGPGLSIPSTVVYGRAADPELPH
jgi:hypothetical protein